MKKTFLLLSILFLTLTNKSVSAQPVYQIYISDVNTSSLEYNVGDKIEGEFTLSNLSDLGQSEMYYNISSGKYSEEYMSISGAYNISSNVGPIYLKSQSKDNIKFTYTLPKSLTGSSAIKISVKLKDGTLLAESVHPVDVVGEVSKESVYFNDPYLTITDFDTKIQPLTGSTVYEGEKINLSFNTTPTIKNYIVKPVLKLYNRSEKEGFLVKTVNLDDINISNNTTKITLDLPVDLNPLVYYGVISFASEEVDINDIHVRYIIAGPIATIRNITTNSLQVKKGDVFDVNVVYGGQPIDEYRPEKQKSNASTTLTVVATNEKGEKISEITQDLDLNNGGESMVTPMTASMSAKSVSFEAFIKNSEGLVLSQYKAVLPSNKDLKNQKSYLDNDSKIIINIALISILILILFFFFIKRMNLKNSTPIAIIFFGLVISLGILKIDSVYAGIAADQQNFLNSLNENSNPTWSVIQESGADSVNFQVTSVSSPLPPAVKTYEPGERFNLNFSASYGDCNNELYRYTAFAYRPVNVWSESPKLNGTIQERFEYWQNFGTAVLNYLVTSDLRARYLEVDLKVLAGVSASKESSLKALVRTANISISNYCSVGTEATCFRLFSFLGMTNRTSSFSVSQLVGFANTQNSQLTSARNILLNAEGNPLGTNNELKNFNFSSVGSLSITPGHAYTAKYINMMYDLNDAIERYTDPSFTIIKNQAISAGSHGTVATPFNVSVVYNAPTKPGYHAVYFYLHQDGNGGRRDKTVRQVICVRGASVCPNERANPVVKINEVKNVTQTNATVNWTFSDENGDSQADYTIKVSTQASFANESLVKTFPGNENRTDIKTVRNHQITGLNPGTVYYVKMVVKSDQPPTTSNWDQADFTFKTSDLVGQCNTTTKDRCIVGNFLDSTDTASEYKWRCLGTNGNNAACSLVIPVNGQCGTTNSVCNKGSLREQTDTSTNYLWQCVGAGGGSTASCSLVKPSTPLCGSSANTRSSGTPSNQSSNATSYLWRCNGTTGTTPVSCTSPINTTIVNGQCGTTNNNCIKGTLRDTTDTTSDYKFSCDGSGGGTNAACSIPKPRAGVCGASDNVCSLGTARNLSDSSTNYLWQCVGVAGGATTSCSLPISTNGQCGSSNNSCIKGNLFDLDDSNSNYVWQCNGINGGSNTSCTLPKSSVVTPVCGTTNGSCIAGVKEELNDTTSYLWKCNGINTTASLTCIATIPSTTVINGVCGLNPGICSNGSLTELDDDENNTRWQCNGINGGSTSLCEIPITTATQPTVNLQKFPLISVKKGGKCTIVWGLSNIPVGSNCILKGLGVDRVLTGSSGTELSPALENNQRYTLECTGTEIETPLKSSVLCRVDSAALEN